jgi:hypothetical protein
MAKKPKPNKGIACTILEWYVTTIWVYLHQLLVRSDTSDHISAYGLFTYRLNKSSYYWQTYLQNRFHIRLWRGENTNKKSCRSTDQTYICLQKCSSDIPHWFSYVFLCQYILNQKNILLNKKSNWIIESADINEKCNVRPYQLLTS